MIYVNDRGIAFLITGPFTPTLRYMADVMALEHLEDVDGCDEFVIAYHGSNYYLAGIRPYLQEYLAEEFAKELNLYLLSEYSGYVEWPRDLHLDGDNSTPWDEDEDWVEEELAPADDQDWEPEHGR